MARDKGQLYLVGDPAAAGFPDLTMTRDGDLLFVELKADGKWPTEDQWCALYDLQEVAERTPHVEVHLVHVKEFDDFIKRLMR